MPDCPPVLPQRHPSSAPSDRQICLYISEMCSELRLMAKRPKLRTISYLLDMARLESERMGKGLPD